jgi:hypothetical protein
MLALPNGMNSPAAGVDEVEQLPQLKNLNSRLKQLVAAAEQATDMLKELAEETCPAWSGVAVLLLPGRSVPGSPEDRLLCCSPLAQRPAPCWQGC